MGFFDGLTQTMQNPLFLGGVSLMSGGGPDGMMQGMKIGNAMMQQRKAQEAIGPALAGLKLGDAERSFFEANPEAASDMLARLYAERFDPMSEVRRKTAEANLTQAQNQNSLFPLQQQELQAKIAQARATAEQGRNGKFGLQPVYGVDANGNPIIMQLGPTGEAVATKLPEGARLDFGLKSRQQEAGKEEGKAQGQAKANLPAAKYNANKMVALIDDVLKDPYLPSMTGPISGRLPNLSGASKRVEAKLSQIQGKTFLQAFESLKGGGQITEVEGAKAEASLQRLKTVEVGTQDYIDALREFRQDVLDLANLAEHKASGGYVEPQSNAQPQAPSGGGGGGWSIERID